jgi:hypothetical protein
VVKVESHNAFTLRLSSDQTSTRLMDSDFR